MANNKVVIFNKASMTLACRDKQSQLTTLLKPGIIPLSIKCDSCDFSDKIVRDDKAKDGFVRLCENCGAKCTLRRGSHLYQSPKGLEDHIKLLYAFTKNKSLDDAADYADFTTRRIGYYYRLWRLCLAFAFQDNLPFFGANEIIEIDESNFRVVKYGRGKKKNKYWVFGMVARGSNVCYLQAVSYRTREVLFPIIKRFVAAGAIIMSDSFRSYATLVDEGYHHRVVVHKYEFVNRDTGAHTQTIEGGIWRWCKEDYKKVNGLTPSVLSLWLMQWCFRCNFLSRYDNRYNFHIVCQAIAKYLPLAKQFVSE